MVIVEEGLEDGRGARALVCCNELIHIDANVEKGTRRAGWLEGLLQNA